MSTYFEKLRVRQGEFYWNVGNLFRRIFFSRDNPLKFQLLVKSYEDVLHAYFLLHARALCERCQHLLLYEGALDEGLDQSGKPDIIFWDGTRDVTCVEVKLIGHEQKSNRKRDRDKVKEQVARYQQEMRDRCTLPTAAIHGIIFSDDSGLETKEYTDLYYGLIPSGFGYTGFGYTGIRVPQNPVRGQTGFWEKRSGLHCK
ncbi:MAG TPA: hypothetical protein VKK79_24105 [Candidatus Lokiarchaeia archaeon]|nr:hypothetical protein [Candidatus Lokiarchaeia archaeon]